MSIEYSSDTKYLNLTAEDILEQSMMIIGPSGTGKSLFIRYVMKLLSGKVGRVIVCCPSNKDQHVYDDVVPAPLIFSELSLRKEASDASTSVPERMRRAAEFTNALIAFQSRLVNIEIKVNNIASLSQIFNMFPEELKKPVAHTLNKIVKEKGNIPTEKYVNLMCRALRTFIGKNRAVWKRGVNPDFDWIIDNIDVNRHTLVICDDCSHEYGRMKTIMTYFFEKARHSGVALLFPAHSDTHFLPELRMQPKFIIYTTQTVAETAIEAKYIKVSKASVAKFNTLKSKMVKTCKEKPVDPVFLAYRADDPTEVNMYLLKPKFVDSTLRMCSPDVRAYCERIQRKK